MARISRALAAAIAAALLIAMLAPAASAKPGDGILLLESYETEPKELTLGEEFELHLTLHNAGTKKADNLLVTLGPGSAGGSGVETAAAGEGGASAGGGLVVVGTGNTKHIGVLGGGRTEIVTFKMQSDPSGSPGLVSLPVALEYSTGGRRALSQTVGLVLRRPTRLRVASLDAPSKATAGEEFDVTAEVTNAGDAKVGGVSVRLAGDDKAAARVEGGETFLGNLEPGDGDVLEAKVTLPKAGAAELSLVVAYADEFGETRETTQTIKITVTPADEPASDEATETAESGGFLDAIAGFFKALFGLGD